MSESSAAPTGEAEGSQAAAESTEPAEKTGTVNAEPTGIRLPGVQTRGDDADLFPDLPRKGKDGKIVSQKQAVEEAEEEMAAEKEDFFGNAPEDPEVRPGEVEKKSAPEPPPKEETPPASADFEFGGKKYKTKEDAEQSHRSLEGMFKPLKDSEQNAIDLAHQWRDWGMAQERRAAGEQPDPNASAPPGTRAPDAGGLDVESILRGINGEQFEKIAQDPERGLPVAGRYLAAQVLDAVHSQLIPKIREDMMAELTKGLQPSREQAAEQQAVKEVTNIYNAARGLRLTDGTQAFPELNDPETMMKVGRVWANSGLPAEHAKTPRGLQQAIASYRMVYGQPQRETPKPTEETPPEPTVQPTAAVSVQTPSSVAPGAGKATPQSAFEKAFSEADLVDPKLGFAVRKRR